MRTGLWAAAWVACLPMPAAAAELERGAAVYQQVCQVCHGDDGTGAMPDVADLADPGGALTKPDAVLMESLMKGVRTPGSVLGMPALGGNPSFTEADMRAVLAYIRREFGATGATKPP